MRNPLWILVAMLLGCVGMLLSGCGSAAPTLASPSSVVVTGTVIDGTTSEGVAGATVTIGGRSTTTDSEGFYRFVDLPTGSTTVTITPPAGYVIAGAADGVSIDLGPNEVIDIYLAPEAEGPPAPPVL